MGPLSVVTQLLGGRPGREPTSSTAQSSDSGRGRASSPGAAFYSMTKPPRYLIKLSERLICAAHMAFSLSPSFQIQ